MLGPTGMGVLYGKKEQLEKTEPLLFGGDMIREVSFESASWNELPWKFEAGTPNMAGAAGLAAAIEYLQKTGMEDIHEHEKILTERAMRKLQPIDELTIYGPEAAKRAGLVAFSINGVHTHDVSALLDTQGIAVRGGHHCAMPLAKLLGVAGTTRASFYLYNTPEEIDKLAEALEMVSEKMKKMTPAATARIRK